VLTLAVTSSTASVGVAIVDSDTDSVLAVHQIATDRRHAEELTPMVARALADAGCGLSDVERFAVDVGPGRFTGLRVGLATVRTFALACRTPVTGVSSLEALAAAQAAREAVSVTAIIDARRAEVFQQRFRVDPDGTPVELGTPLVGRPETFLSAIGVSDVVVGDGADRYPDLYGDRRQAGFEPSPVVIARLAAGRVGVAGHLVVPRYLREPDVQINIRTRST
jgi:tRNA threonylcarbamoyl adenosine modification protein YeaZ